MTVRTLVLPRVDTFAAVNATETPDPVVITRWLTEFVPRFPHAPFWAALGGIKVWCGSANIHTPADLRNPDGTMRGGATMPHTLSILLNSDYTVRDVLAHELGHCAQHYYSILPTSADPLCRQLWQAWREMPGPDGEEDFANAMGAHLLGLRTVQFMRNFPLVMAAVRSNAWPVANMGYGDGAVVWMRLDPNGLNSYHERISADGRHQKYQMGQWRDV